jgi:hypothetical protein
MYKIQWRPSNQKPEHNQFCHIRGENDYIVLEVCYKQEADAWLNLFATLEAGHIYAAKDVSGWIPADELDADLPEEWVKEELAETKPTTETVPPLPIPVHGFFRRILNLIK